jgi:hypothetical protein
LFRVLCQTKSIQLFLHQIKFKTSSNYLPEIERSNQTIKECALTLVHGLPYTKLPMLFVQHLMMHVVHYLNIFPWNYGVSTELSPETIMTGFPLPDYNKLKIEFGSYAQLFDVPSPSNTPQSHTHGAIALGATGNAGGAFYFLSLVSGEILSRHQWTVCTIQEEVIKKLEVLAIKDKQSIIQSTGLLVEWCQVSLDTFSLDIPINPTHNPDIVIDQYNHELTVRVSKNDSDNNSVHENLDTGFDDDDQENEVEQNIEVVDIDIPFENRGAAYEHDAMNMMNPM